MGYEEYGGVPGSHQTGPIASEYGFRVGKKGDTKEIIDKDGKLVGAPVWNSILSAGVGYGGDYAGDSSLDVDLVDTVSGDHDVLIIVTVTEAFADSGGNDQAVFSIGDGIDDEKFMADDVLKDAPEGFQYVFTGELPDNKKVELKRTEEQDPACTGEANIMVFVKAQ